MLLLLLSITSRTEDFEFVEKGKEKKWCGIMRGFRKRIS